MKVGFISQWYPPENIWVPKSVVDALRRFGHDVTVVTGTPHYPTGTVAEGYSAYRYSQDAIDEVKIIRSPEYPYRGTGVLGRFAGYASFALSSCIASFRHLRDSDLIIVYASPATSAVPAMALSAMARVPFILQVQDIWPDSVTDSGFITRTLLAKTVQLALTALVRASYRMASEIIVISEGAKRLLVSRGVPAEKVTVVYNWVADPAERPIEPAEPISLRQLIDAKPDDRVFLYAGALGKAQDVGTIISSFKAAKISPRARLVVVGSGVEKEPIQALAEEVPGAHVLDQVDLFTAAAWTTEADFGIVSLTNTPLHNATFPSKIQFLCGLSTPLLVRAPGEASSFVNETGAGIGVAEAGTKTLANLFQQLAETPVEEIQRMSANARRSYETYFGIDSGSKALSQVIDRMAVQTPRARFCYD
ncbi:UNVERIFIED_ORG: glycosyl transferase family 1 [Dietzia maris]|uniref:glycosyltransferase family 4 protein n=1 Tax=Dietzia maris TaxID=37915 RepID=UPI001051CFDB